MKQIAILLFIIALHSVIADAQPKPRWVQKGVKAMNNERLNKNYGFHTFATFGADINQLKAERFKPLMEFFSKPMSVKF